MTVERIVKSVLVALIVAIFGCALASPIIYTKAFNNGYCLGCGTALTYDGDYVSGTRYHTTTKSHYHCENGCGGIDIPKVYTFAR